MLRIYMLNFKSLLIERPSTALTIDEWQEWEESTKQKHPIKWVLFETIPDKIDSLFYPIKHLVYDKWYWGFKYRFIPKHQHHIIKPTTLAPGYHGVDELILHSSFQLLSDFVIKELNNNRVDWSATKEHQEAWDEIDNLYNWWNYIYPDREYQLDIDYPYPNPPAGVDDDMSWIFSDKYKYTKEYKLMEEISIKRQQQQEKFDREDEENLTRLIKIRKYLWH